MKAATFLMVFATVVLDFVSRDHMARAQPLQESPAVFSYEEAVYKHHTIRTILNKRTSALNIEYDGVVVGTVADVGAVRKPIIVPGPDLSLVAIWTKTVRQGCSSYVLIAMDFADYNRPVEMKSGFGSCGTLLQTLRLQNGNFESWAAIAYRKDAPGVSVAVPRNAHLAVSPNQAKPCLFAEADQKCGLEYVAAAYGPWGIPTGDERVARHRISTFYNRVKHTGRIEIDGRRFKEFSGIKNLFVDPSIAFDLVDVFSVWLEPADSACGYRIFLKVTDTGNAQRVHDRVGPCRSKIFTQRVESGDGKALLGWGRVMVGKGDAQFDTVLWTGGDTILRTAEADPCLSVTPISQQCLETLGSPELRALAQGASLKHYETDRTQPLGTNP